MMIMMIYGEYDDIIMIIFSGIINMGNMMIINGIGGFLKWGYPF